MTPRPLLRSLALIAVLFSAQCAQEARIAFLDATIVLEAQGIGDVGKTGRARVNFTRFNQPLGSDGNDDKLRMQFSNAAGDYMTFVVSPVDGEFPQHSSWSIDGNEASFEASFTVTIDNAPQPISVTHDPAFANFINVFVADISETGFLRAIDADFATNFEGGGTSNGWMVYQAPSAN